MSKHARVTVSPAWNASLPQRWVRLGAGGTAIGFGVLTVLAGWSVLVGVRDPGHAVLQPLLIFNAVMGLLYLATGRQILSRRDSARWSAGLIALANAIVLGVLLTPAVPVTGDSLASMGVRTGVWLAITGALFWTSRARKV
jgi:multisubunit Na+/H+ antiporter MnhB subunit